MVKDMYCDHCGECCKDTEMMLSEEDVKRIERLGLKRNEFSYEKDGFLFLKNKDGFCVFYNKEQKRCNIYPYRPLGCRFYPIIFDLEDQRVIVDKLCHLWHTVTDEELKRVKPRVKKFVRRLLIERSMRLKKKNEETV